MAGGSGGPLRSAAAGGKGPAVRPSCPCPAISHRAAPSRGAGASPVGQCPPLARLRQQALREVESLGEIGELAFERDHAVFQIRYPALRRSGGGGGSTHFPAHHAPPVAVHEIPS